MRLLIEALPGEVEAKALPLLAKLSLQLAAVAPSVAHVAAYLAKAEIDAGLVRLEPSADTMPGTMAKGAYPAVRRYTFAGLPIAVETPKGTARNWHDAATGRSGKTWMQHDYGFIDGTRGADGDPYDVFIGPDEHAPLVYVVHQARPGTGELYDEDKAMLGFPDVHAAAAAYLAHYDDPNFLAAMSVLPIDEFRAKVRTLDDGYVKSREPVFVIDDPRSVMAKGLAPELAAGGSKQLGDANIVGGGGGLNIALGVPSRPVPTLSTMPVTSDLERQGANGPGGLRAGLDQALFERDRDFAVRRDPSVYHHTEMAMLPIHPLPEWEARAAVGADVRAVAPENLDWIQDKLDRRSHFIEQHPERLLPRDDRDQATFFIPHTPETT